MQPTESGWSSSISPLAIVVVAKGRRWRSTARRASSRSARRIADAPITATGRRAAPISAAARLRSAAAAGSGGGGGSSAGTASVAGIVATSSGRSRWTGPCGSQSAIRSASATVAATRPGRKARLALEMGANSA